MAAVKTFSSVSGGTIEAQHFNGQWTISASRSGKILDTLTDRETPSDDAIRIFLSNCGMIDLQGDLQLYVKQVMLKAKHGNGY